jgi:hypothetical protein
MKEQTLPRFRIEDWPFALDPKERYSVVFEVAYDDAGEYDSMRFGFCASEQEAVELVNKVIAGWKGQ